MSLETYYPSKHTVDALSDSIKSLPEEFVLVGSIGRCVLMGELKSLRRVNGTASDIDVIDLTGKNTAHSVHDVGNFRVDAGTTKLFRPVEDSWGLFLPGQTDPFTLIDGELCQPQVVAVPWAEACSVKVEPLAIQSLLTVLLSPRTKNKHHTDKFNAFANAEVKALPVDVQKQFEDYKAISWSIDKYGTVENPYSLAERAYRSTRRTYMIHAPSVVQTVVSKTIAPTIRSIRGTRA